MTRLRFRTVPLGALPLLLLLGSAAPAPAAPEGTLTYAVHVTLAARWLDPADLIVVEGEAT